MQNYFLSSPNWCSSAETLSRIHTMNNEKCTTPQCEICIWMGVPLLIFELVKFFRNSELGRHGFCITVNNVFVQRLIQPLSKLQSFLNLIGTFLKDSAIHSVHGL